MNLEQRTGNWEQGTELRGQEAETTLRLIAALPAPAGLEDRIHAGLRAHLQAAPRRANQRGRVLAWPLNFSDNFMRLAAAAALACIVVGGGWGVYSRIPHSQTAKAIVAPRATLQGGFSNAGAMRTPQTLNGPILLPAVKPTVNLTPAHPANPPAAVSKTKNSLKQRQTAVNAKVQTN